MRLFSLLLVLAPLALMQWRSMTPDRVEIHHFPSGTLKKPVRPLSKDWVWQAPQEWILQPPREHRLATYTIPSGQGHVELAISELPGDAGSLLSNVNRWRGQLGLKPLEEPDLVYCIFDVPSAVPGARLVEVPSPSDTDSVEGRMLVGCLQTTRTSTFFKVTGEGDLMKSVRGPFLAFLQTVRRRDPEGSIR